MSWTMLVTMLDRLHSCCVSRVMNRCNSHLNRKVIEDPEETKLAASFQISCERHLIAPASTRQMSSDFLRSDRHAIPPELRVKGRGSGDSLAKETTVLFCLPS